MQNQNFSYVMPNQFQPNSVTGWNTIGNVTWQQPDAQTILLTNTEQFQIKISFLSASAFRVRFNPTPNPDYSYNRSYAVVNYNLGPCMLTVLENLIMAVPYLLIQVFCKFMWD